MVWSYSCSTPRHHRLVVGLSKFVFLHPQHGVVFAQEPLPHREALSLGLSTLILYAVSPIETPVHWIVFSREARPLAEVLEEAWNKGEGLRGPPDRVLVSRYLKEHVPSINASLASYGVEVEVVNKADKAHAAVLRTVQSKAAEVSFCLKDKALTLDGLNESAQEYYRLWLTLFDRPKGQKVASREVYGQLPARAPPPIVRGRRLDWVPGAWLCSHESAVEHALPRCFYQCDGITRLLTGSAYDVALAEKHRLKHFTSAQETERKIWAPDSEPENGYDPLRLTDTDEDDEAEEDEADDSDFMEELEAEADLKNIRAMLRCWPNTYKEVAHAADMTLKELNRNLSGKHGAGVDALGRVFHILGFEIDDEGYRVPVGPCALIFRTLRSAQHCFNALSAGGDQRYGFEVLPKNGIPDPSFRYLLFESHGDNPCVLMIPRGQMAGGTLDKHFINCRERPELVDVKFYRGLMTACSKACASPESNTKVMEQWAYENRKELENFETQTNWP